MDRASSQNGRRRNDLTILSGKPIGKSLLESPRHRWEGSIGIYLKRIVVNTSWFDSAQGRGY